MVEAAQCDFPTLDAKSFEKHIRSGRTLNEWPPSFKWTQKTKGIF